MRQTDQGSLVLPLLTGLGTLAALLMSAIALIDSNASTRPSALRAPVVGAVGSEAGATAPGKVLDLKIIASHKLGPDGKKHDAISQSEFAVKVGRPLTLRIDNTDNQPHSITAPLAGVNIIAMPGTHSYALIVNKAGRFPWRCIIVCDTGAAGWAMTHRGYLSGFITAT